MLVNFSIKIEIEISVLKNSKDPEEGKSFWEFRHQRQRIGPYSSGLGNASNRYWLIYSLSESLCWFPEIASHRK